MTRYFDMVRCGGACALPPPFGTSRSRSRTYDKVSAGTAWL
jgi:hypothetical protein